MSLERARRALPRAPRFQKTPKSRRPRRIFSALPRAFSDLPPRPPFRRVQGDSEEVNCIALDRYRVATAVVRMQPARARGGSGGSARSSGGLELPRGKATLTKPSVIRVGQQFQAEVPAWHGPVPWTARRR